ncbi:UDP-4-amino-4,6-dideoxy-N-acetyl-beta-L-altrosamine transaminase [Alteromonas lipolytica]|uniref:UDP-4-amino-4, 6-dideoxy-N-acetyl-beta-L-altrosamine transaminase n=1 Tax=Alteromonas lipolytica TaxID=1856405 RepID=A0A1E8FF48_9ALTE|nr:UDP-4-amino-4,6-dideoxy-N-acetyl-beta-L-altrosamine transaminase [Alteromonas lipolytica]OFI34577.1 UDP-4-amino-4,6-dideoxy-N-acetyl-beta-L-altrosamine transaminase [Alteromonas lipolytica]GGF52208.1 UDP-4-amino-4,6-dideoxy-N-acetyl-beta-L-altrosamine transaminase [Alteromonas lipolytica]
MIPYGKHTIFPDDVSAVTEVLEQGFLTQGQQVPAFEKALCDYTGAGYAVACNSGTSGLHIACLAAGVKAGDVVWTVPNSFAASANCARYCGAEVDFVDIDPHTRNICTSALVDKLHLAAAANKVPKAIIVVHFAGSSCDMAAISAITEPFGILLIEDAAHALGAKDPQMHKVGAGKYSAMTVLSFHPVKSITSAEGGAVLTNDEDLAAMLRCYASHGITRDPAMLGDEHQDEPWFYAQFELGFNYRLSDVHAALGRSQLKHLDDFVAQRLALAKVYHDALSELPLIRPVLDENSAWHLYMIELTQHDRKQVFNALRQRGIGVNVHYIPIHLHPYYQQLGFKAGQYPHAEHYYRRALTLPLFPALTADNQMEVIKQLSEVLS